MRILDHDHDRSLNNVILYLTQEEAAEFSSTLISLLASNTVADHGHISSKDYKKEITICSYDMNNLEGFDERSKKLILEGE